MRMLVAICIAACTSSGGGSTSEHFISFSFDSTSYSSSLVGTATLQMNTVGGNSLELEASDNDGNVLAIAVEPGTPESTIATGPYTAPAQARFELTEGMQGRWVADASHGTGSIEITSLTATDIQGTFAAILVGVGGTGDLTDGQFQLAITMPLVAR